MNTNTKSSSKLSFPLIAQIILFVAVIIFMALLSNELFKAFPDWGIL